MPLLSGRVGIRSPGLRLIDGMIRVLFWLGAGSLTSLTLLVGTRLRSIEVI